MAQKDAILFSFFSQVIQSWNSQKDFRLVDHQAGTSVFFVSCTHTFFSNLTILSWQISLGSSLHDWCGSCQHLSSGTWWHFCTGSSKQVSEGSFRHFSSGMISHTLWGTDTQRGCATLSQIWCGTFLQWVFVTTLHVSTGTFSHLSTET